MMGIRITGNMRGRFVGVLAALGVAIASVGASRLVAASGQGDEARSATSRGKGHDGTKLIAFGLTDDGRLIRFRTDAPKRARDVGAIAGLSGRDTALVGIDFRVQDGQLYGVGNGGGVYTIDTRTALATFVNSLTVPLAGTSFGVDFNPAADRLRIVSDAGQNLAHNVNAGGTTVSNSALTYTAPPAAPVAALGVTAAAYTNNDLQATTGTTLFDVDTTLDQVSIQSPPGAGILLATGNLGVDAGAKASLDIYSHLSSGVTVRNRAYAVLTVGGTASLYAVNVLTGAVTAAGAFDHVVIDLAIALVQ